MCNSLEKLRQTLNGMSLLKIQQSVGGTVYVNTSRITKPSVKSGDGWL